MLVEAYSEFTTSINMKCKPGPPWRLGPLGCGRLHSLHLPHRHSPSGPTTWSRFGGQVMARGRVRITQADIIKRVERDIAEAKASGDGAVTIDIFFANGILEMAKRAKRAGPKRGRPSLSIDDHDHRLEIWQKVVTRKAELQSKEKSISAHERIKKPPKGLSRRQVRRCPSKPSRNLFIDLPHCLEKTPTVNPSSGNYSGT